MIVCCFWCASISFSCFQNGLAFLGILDASLGGQRTWKCRQLIKQLHHDPRSLLHRLPPPLISRIVEYIAPMDFDYYYKLNDQPQTIAKVVEISLKSLGIPRLIRATECQSFGNVFHSEECVLVFLFMVWEAWQAKRRKNISTIAKTIQEEHGYNNYLCKVCLQEFEVQWSDFQLFESNGN